MSDKENDIQLKSVKSLDGKQDEHPSDQPPAYDDYLSNAKNGRNNPAYVADSSSSQESLNNIPTTAVPNDVVQVEDVTVVEVATENGLRHRHVGRSNFVSDIIITEQNRTPMNTPLMCSGYGIRLCSGRSRPQIQDRGLFR